ncbi:hypothetical protein SALBM217S_01495 [Streptomyces griseoloalbus]
MKDTWAGPVTYGLLAAWALHDLEEPATLPGSLRRNVPALRERFPEVPERSRYGPRRSTGVNSPWRWA